jgi:hypothetical protein
MTVRTALIVLLSSLSPALAVAQQACGRSAEKSDFPATRLADLPSELRLLHGNLLIINIYKSETLTLRELQGCPPDQVVDALVAAMYRPYPSFWQGYLGDESHFRRWATSTLLPRRDSVLGEISAVLALNLDSLFTSSAAWIATTTRHEPHGVWYLVFGPGWTDMGGFTDGSMVADFTKLVPARGQLEFKLPHELTHEVHGARLGAATDPDRGTVLSRIVSEGLACYAAYTYAAGRLTPAQSLGYTQAEWQWALDHEGELVAAARPYLRSTKREDDNRFASRDQKVLEAGPTAVAYFLGFRLVQSYVAEHGAASWTDLLDVPLGEALSRSGYSLAESPAAPVIQASGTPSLACHVRGPQEWLATRPSPLDSVTVTVGGTVAKICYSRPSARGRSVDSMLPAGTAWRMGANEPTTITLTGRLIVGGALLSAGRYVMLAVPGAKQWMVGFYTTPDSEPVKMFQSLKEVASGVGVVEPVVSAREKFAIRVDPSGTTSDVLLEWGTLRVRLPVHPAP